MGEEGLSGTSCRLAGRDSTRPLFDFVFLLPLFSQECTDLREELDAQHKKRMESFEIQLKPIIIRDGPSKKVFPLKLLFCVYLDLQGQGNGLYLLLVYTGL